jgi:sporulation protein YlmC with PRC-barrel domain
MPEFVAHEFVNSRRSDAMRNSLFTAAAALALMGATAMAQNVTTPAPTAANPTPTVTANPPAPMPAGAPNFVTVHGGDMLSSNVVGLDIYNDQNNDIGKIQDVVFDGSKKVTGYILSVGGFLGMGTHYVTVDPDSVKVTYDASNKVWRATMNATKDQLKSVPEFKYQGERNASRS